ncbi:ParA family protein [Methylomonas sp. DH-1]|uniref:ParA family protein n=1 Tax=Methylomonas sp. (strain DH-1) TaxID=1727196 RepID=UPI000ADF1616|nr:AAA family ATPase [Methylomonas sp. DH-1]
MGKIVTFFNHKGGVGKTTLVHNLAFILAERGYRVLLIDADSQMNLTAAMYGLSTSIEYSMDDSSKWKENVQKYISFSEYIGKEVNETECGKTFFEKKLINEETGKEGVIDLISGDINLAMIEANLYGVVTQNNEFTRKIPGKFEKSIRGHKKNYDFVFIDTSPSANSIINALIMLSSDFFIAPVSPSFFSLQAVDNLSSIFQNWIELLKSYQTTRNFDGLSFQPKFLGLVVQMAKRFNSGQLKNEDNTEYSRSTEKWISDLNNSVQKFYQYSILRGMSISEDDFRDIFKSSEPFVIQKCCDFTPQLRSIAEKAGVPVVSLTQALCRTHRDSVPVDIENEGNQYAKSFKSISKSYNAIADGLIELLAKQA